METNTHIALVGGATVTVAMSLADVQSRLSTALRQGDAWSTFEGVGGERVSIFLSQIQTLTVLPDTEPLVSR